MLNENGLHFMRKKSLSGDLSTKRVKKGQFRKKTFKKKFVNN
jgi:hypothetical protein